MKDDYNKYLYNNKIINDNYEYNKIMKNEIEKDNYIYNYGKIDKYYDYIPLNKFDNSALAALLNALDPYPSQTTPATPPSVAQPQSQPSTPLVVRQITPPVTLVEKQNDKSSKETINQFMRDMLECSPSQYFRGWILPNGELISQYYGDNKTRQDHSKLIKLFISGLESYDTASYQKVMELYNDYVARNYNAHDIYESFAVDVLGWMQISEFGRKRISCRGERWQDKFIGPFINGFGFQLNESKNGQCYNHLFPNLYDDLKQVITFGLEKQMSEQMDMVR